MAIEHRLVIDSYKNSRVKTEINDTELPEWEARLACNLIERWGVVAAAPDGEDSSGHAKYRKLTPEELVSEACETASLAVAEFRKRGWVHITPTLAEREAFKDALPG